MDCIKLGINEYNEYSLVSQDERRHSRGVWPRRTPRLRTETGARRGFMEKPSSCTDETTDRQLRQTTYALWPSPSLASVQECVKSWGAYRFKASAARFLQKASKAVHSEAILLVDQLLKLYSFRIQLVVKLLPRSMSFWPTLKAGLTALDSTNERRGHSSPCTTFKVTFRFCNTP